MRSLMTACLLVLGFALHAANVKSDIPEGPKIRVLLARDVPSVLLEAKGEYAVHRHDTGALLSFGSVGKRFVVHAIRDGLRWGEEYPDIFAVNVFPRSSETSVFVDGIQYRGAITVYHTRDNHITVINELPIEDFLKSTLAPEFEHPLTKEAMAAVVIAARTNAYAETLNTTNKLPWDITAEDAKYYGFGITQRSNGVDRAVDLTRHMVMETKGGIQKVKVAQESAQELAQRGCDARKILQSVYPQSKVSVPYEVHYR